MAQISPFEKKSFFFFLTLIIFTAFNFLFFGNHVFALGALSILWGLFGFFRFIHLSETNFKNFSRVINLPTQILFGAQKIETQKRADIFNRYLRWDILIFIMLSFLFFMTIIVNSLFPAEFSILENFRLSQENLTQLPLTKHINFYGVLQTLSAYVLMGLMMLVTLSYSQDRRFFSTLLMVLFPIFCASMAYFLIYTSMTSPVIMPDFAQIRGVGAGQGTILFQLSGSDIAASLSPLTLRHTEFGMIGAYGVYVLFMPALWMLLKTLRQNSWSHYVTLAGLSVMAFLLIADAFWQGSLLQPFFQILGVVIIALCWGTAGMNPKKQ